MHCNERLASITDYKKLGRFITGSMVMTNRSTNFNQSLIHKVGMKCSESVSFIKLYLVESKSSTQLLTWVEKLSLKAAKPPRIPMMRKIMDTKHHSTPQHCDEPPRADIILY